MQYAVIALKWRVAEQLLMHMMSNAHDLTLWPSVVKRKRALRSLVETLEICEVMGKSSIASMVMRLIARVGIQYNFGFAVWLHLNGYHDAAKGFTASLGM